MARLSADNWISLNTMLNKLENNNDLEAKELNTLLRLCIEMLLQQDSEACADDED